jgi:hypothetical protein
MRGIKMAEMSGVCAIVPRHQEGFRPKVIGMGILVDDLEMVTCAHVVDAAIGEGWFGQPGDCVVRVCFPFVAGSVCVNGTVDRKRYFRPDRAEEGKLTDIAVVLLSDPAPAEVGRVVLRGHVNDALVLVFGFRQKELETGDWVNHEDGEIVESKILGPLPGGRVYFEGIRSTGAAVEPGFSGAAVFDPRQGAVVGMVVKASAEPGRNNAQFIDVASLWKALGRTPPPQTYVPQRPGIPGPGQFIIALCHLTEGEFRSIVVVMGISEADVGGADLHARAVSVYNRIARPGRNREESLLRLKSEIERLYPDAFTSETG